MNRATIFVASFLGSTLAFTQTPVSKDRFIASRQTEVERLAESLYATRLDNGRWTRKDIPQCTVFTHHLFVRFDGTSMNGVTPRFIAIYDLDHPSSRSVDKPWQGGITLLRVNSEPQIQQDFNPGEDALISAFNRTLAQENAAIAAHAPLGLDSLDVTNCYIGASGNEPMPVLPAEDLPEMTSKTPAKASTILIPLVSSPGIKRTEYVEFDQKGAITKAGIQVHHTP